MNSREQFGRQAHHYVASAVHASGTDDLVHLLDPAPDAVALDVGNQDPFVTTNRQLADALTRVDVAQTLEVYEGDHMNHIRDRFELKVLPFFSRQLAATGGK